MRDVHSLYTLDHSHIRAALPSRAEFQTQPLTEPSTDIPLDKSLESKPYHMSRVSFSHTAPSSFFSRVRSNAFQARLTRRTLISSSHSGQFGKAWAPTLGIWGVGAGTAALFVCLHIFSNHNAQYLLINPLSSTVPFRNTNRQERFPGQTPTRACPFVRFHTSFFHFLLKTFTATYPPPNSTPHPLLISPPFRFSRWLTRLLGRAFHSITDWKRL